MVYALRLNFGADDSGRLVLVCSGGAICGDAPILAANDNV